MSKYKLIALDMDGTLLNGKKQITKEIIDGINRAFDQKKEVVLCTGRCLPELEEYFDKIPRLRYSVCVSGGYIYDNLLKRIVYENVMDNECILKLINYGKQHGLMIHLLNEKSYVEERCLNDMSAYNMQTYIKMFQNVSTPVDDMLDFFTKEPQNVHKLNLYHKSLLEREESRKYLSTLNIELTNSEYASLECTAKGVTKGTGLKAICDIVGISPSEAIAVGDSENDVGMLNAAGLSVAMGNSSKKIIDICDKKVADNEHDGVLEAIEKFLLD